MKGVWVGERRYSVLLAVVECGYWGFGGGLKIGLLKTNRRLVWEGYPVDNQETAPKVRNAVPEM